MRTEDNDDLTVVARDQPQIQKLFDRVASIVDKTREEIARAVNNRMVVACWLIGREIVEEIQEGEERAGYGERVLEELSHLLSGRYGRGYSVTNLRYFRLFYQTYPHRTDGIHHTSDESLPVIEREQIHHSSDDLEFLNFSVEEADNIQGFSPNLTWTHYRTLLKVENNSERLFYELEADKEGWSVAHLKRQIDTLLFARLLKSRDKKGLMELVRKGQELKDPVDTIKDPYILDFLDIPDSEILHESKLEEAIISNIQSFLLELGKGFAFVGRQKRLQFDDTFFYIDLVFYNCILKCYLLIDLKIGELTHQDIGQMDGYVRMFDDRYITQDDNPTIGLILCSKKNETIAKYSVLDGSRQLFASKYMLYLPTEEELKREIEHQRQLIEEGSNHDQ